MCHIFTLLRSFDNFLKKQMYFSAVMIALILKRSYHGNRTIVFLK